MNTISRGRSTTPTCRVVACAALLALVGCASQPGQVDPAAAVQPAQTGNEASSLASALDAENRAEAANLAADAVGLPAEGTDPLAANLAKARKLGYRIVDRNGETVYCSESTATGSHVNKRTICLTEKQWNDVSMANQRAMERLQKNSTPCPQGGGCGG